MWLLPSDLLGGIVIVQPIQHAGIYLGHKTSCWEQQNSHLARGVSWANTLGGATACEGWTSLQFDLLNSFSVFWTMSLPCTYPVAMFWRAPLVSATSCSISSTVGRMVAILLNLYYSSGNWTLPSKLSYNENSSGKGYVRSTQGRVTNPQALWHRSSQSDHYIRSPIADWRSSQPFGTRIGSHRIDVLASNSDENPKINLSLVHETLE